MRERIELGGHRGWRYAKLPREIETNLARWLDDEHVDGALELKPGRVWRLGDWAAKLSRPRRAADAWLRRSAAVRAADLHAKLAPIPTPQPLVALDKRANGRLIASLLISEFVDGERLPQVWRRGHPARAAYPLFLAEMHRRGVFHGDLGAFNTLWDSRRWVLLDLDGVRGRLHGLRRVAIVVDQWARALAVLEDPTGVREAFDVYLRHAPRLNDPERVWSRVEKLASKYARDLAEKRKRLGTA